MRYFIGSTHEYMTKLTENDIKSVSYNPDEPQFKWYVETKDGIERLFVDLMILEADSFGNIEELDNTEPSAYTV